ncbi:MAG: aldo/keto reductase [Actinomycetota bacterium]
MVAVVAAAADAGFGAIDVSRSWGPLELLSGTRLPVHLRVSPVNARPGEHGPSIAEAYPAHDLVAEIDAARCAGLELARVTFHTWFSSWAGNVDASELLGLVRNQDVAVGIACPDSNPDAALAVASDVDAISLQLNVSNQRSTRYGSVYRDAGCAVEARAPFDAGAAVGVALYDHDAARRRVFAPFEPEVRRLVRTVEVASAAAELTPAELCVRWVVSHPWVTELCVGASSEAQIGEIAQAAAAGPLDPSLVQSLEAVDWSWRYDD